MKTIRLIILFVVIFAFIACDDDWLMDLEPPYGGYIWRVSNGTSGYVGKLNPVEATWIEGYGTPFGSGYNYDAAAGDGRVWVAGLMYIDDSPGLYIWEVNGDTFRAPAHGLTWDGEYLFWGGATTFIVLIPTRTKVS